jgi:hypothetical protein
MSICIRCGAAFGCAMLGEMDGPCWCTQLPPIVPVPAKEVSGCMCPGCLKLHIEVMESSVTPPARD